MDITGTLSRPKLALSNPDNLPLSESDLLSYLVTGEPAVGLDNSARRQVAKGLGIRTLSNILMNAVPQKRTRLRGGCRRRRRGPPTRPRTTPTPGYYGLLNTRAVLGKQLGSRWFLGLSTGLCFVNRERVQGESGTCSSSTGSARSTARRRQSSPGPAARRCDKGTHANAASEPDSAPARLRPFSQLAFLKRCWVVSYELFDLPHSFQRRTLMAKNLRERDLMMCRSCGNEERASEGYPCADCGTFVCIICNFRGVTLCKSCRAKRPEPPMTPAKTTEDRLARALSESVTAIAAIAPMLCEPDVKTTQVSQLLHGHIALVVERKGLWLHVKGADGYPGWVHQGYVVTMPEPVPPLAETGWNDPRPLSLGCTVRDEHGATRKLPLGALITEGQERFGGLAMTSTSGATRFRRSADSITASAMTFFEGTSYEWGGVTPWGCDCSGPGVELISSARRARTARRVDAGDDGRRRWIPCVDLRPADLLFFSDEPEGRSRTSPSRSAERGSFTSRSVAGATRSMISQSGDEYTDLLVQRFRFARRILS